MAIEYKFDNKGGFFAVDRSRNAISYAYPNSDNAKWAAKDSDAAQRIAEKMVTGAVEYREMVRNSYLRDAVEDQMTGLFAKYEKI